MPKIRLLESVVGFGPVVGRPGDVLEVDEATARVWCDGVRAEPAEVRVPELEDTMATPRTEKAVTRARRR